MPKKLCDCGQCEYCHAYLRFQMNQEYGRGEPSGDSRIDRVTNFLHHQQNEEMCNEFGTGGTTYNQRKKSQGPMPQGEELIDSLSQFDPYNC